LLSESPSSTALANVFTVSACAGRDPVLSVMCLVMSLASAAMVVQLKRLKAQLDLNKQFLDPLQRSVQSPQADEDQGHDTKQNRFEKSGHSILGWSD
jgi:hypothetical protein